MRTYLFLLLMCCAAFNIAADMVAPADVLPRELTLATELEHKGELKEAERVLLEFITASEAAGDRQNLSVALNNLAILYGIMERPADAERYFKRAIRLLETIEGPGGTYALARTKLHFASFYIELGRLREADKLNVRAVLDQLRAPGDHARARSMLAALAMARNDFAVAEEMLLGVLSFWQANPKLYKADTEIATALNNLGIIAWRQRRTETALSRLHQSLNVWRGVIGPTNPLLAKMMMNLAVVCAESGRYAEAAEWQQQALAVAQHAFGDSHPFTVTMQSVYADILKKAGRKTEAGQVARAAAEARKSLRSPSVADYTVDYRDHR